MQQQLLSKAPLMHALLNKVSKGESSALYFVHEPLAQSQNSVFPPSTTELYINQHTFLCEAIDPQPHVRRELCHKHLLQG